MESLDAFLKNIDTVQLGIDEFHVVAEVTEKYTPKENLKDREIAAFNQHQQMAKVLKPPAPQQRI
jgi:hypothetical protein